jgi:EAL domain-containing protein (putative c-di-GMP-specific phosphodiesterase class I)
VRDVHTNLESEAIVKMIIALANTLSIKVLAEGVMDERQKQHLRQLGCDIMQGDLICAPLPVADFTVSVEKRIMEQA